MMVVSSVLLAPVLVIVLRSLQGRDGSFGPSAVLATISDPTVIGWLGDSAILAAVTVLVTVVVSAPAGYALARGRGRAVAAMSITVFSLQSVPVVLFLTPLFILFIPLGLVDDLAGVAVVFVGLSVAVGTWTMSSVFASVPIEVEEAAWLDGCSIAGAFLRVVLPNAGGGLLSTAVLAFLLAWNDYWIASVFLLDPAKFTVGLALAGSGGGPALALLAPIPPLVVFAVFHRVFRFSGTSGSLGSA